MHHSLGKFGSSEFLDISLACFRTAARDAAAVRGETAWHAAVASMSSLSK